MEDLYRNIRLPGSFSGIITTRRYSGRPRAKVLDFLSGVEAYTLHKQGRKRFTGRAVYSKGVADLVQADLVDLTHLARYNDGSKFVLSAIDVFSKEGWAVPLKTSPVAKWLRRSKPSIANDALTFAKPIREASSSARPFSH